MLKQLDSFEVNYDSKNYDKKFALHAAATQQSTTILSFLLEKGCEVNGLDKGGKSPLFEAIKVKNKGAISILLKHGGKIIATKQQIAILILK